MKLSKLSLLSVLFIALLSTISCTSQIQKKTAFLESDLFISSQRQELNALSSKKKLLAARPATKKSKDQMATLELDELKIRERLEIPQMGLVPDELAGIINPPCPDPRDCGEIDGLQTLYSFNDISAIVYAGKKKIGVLSTTPKVIDAKTGLKAYDFKIKTSYKGPVTLRVTRLNNIGQKITYDYKTVLK